MAQALNAGALENPYTTPLALLDLIQYTQLNEFGLSEPAWSHVYMFYCARSKGVTVRTWIPELASRDRM